MAKEEVFGKFDYEIKPDKNHAQILIGITSSSKSFEEAKKIIEELGVRIIEISEHLPTHFIVVKLDVKDMRDIVLKLTENGFSIIKGINATNQNWKNYEK